MKIHLSVYYDNQNIRLYLLQWRRGVVGWFRSKIGHSCWKTVSVWTCVNCVLPLRSRCVPLTIMKRSYCVLGALVMAAEKLTPASWQRRRTKKVWTDVFKLAPFPGFEVERAGANGVKQVEKKVPVPGAKEGVLVPEAKKEVLVPEAKKGPLVPEAIFEQLKDVLSTAVKEEQWNLAQMVRNLSLTRESAAFLLQTLSLLSIYYWS